MTQENTTLELKAELYDLNKEYSRQTQMFQSFLQSLIEITDYDSKDGIDLQKLVEHIKEKIKKEDENS